MAVHGTATELGALQPRRRPRHHLGTSTLRASATFLAARFPHFNEKEPWVQGNGGLMLAKVGDSEPGRKRRSHDGFRESRSRTPILRHKLA